MKTSSRLISTYVILLTFTATIFGVAGVAFAQKPVVYSVLFFSPTCGACERVINESLPPLLEKYGKQLIVEKVDITTSAGQDLYLAAHRSLNIPKDVAGVPLLIVGERYLFGARDIPAHFPDLIETGLGAGGIALPVWPGLSTYLQAGASQATQAQSSGSDLPDWQAKFLLDPVANTLAVIVLVAMLLTLGYSVYRFLNPSGASRLLPALPWLALIGLFIAGYMSYIEISSDNAICGPVGDCNAVQQSPYARIWGIIPVGVLGMVAYIAMIGLSLLRKRFAHWSWVIYATWLFGLVGVIFSIYLTFLEPFVIGASCIWCLSSAIVITLILISATPAAQDFQDQED